MNKNNQCSRFGVIAAAILALTIALTACSNPAGGGGGGGGGGDGGGNSPITQGGTYYGWFIKDPVHQVYELTASMTVTVTNDSYTGSGPYTLKVYDGQNTADGTVYSKGTVTYKDTNLTFTGSGTPSFKGVVVFSPAISTNGDDPVALDLDNDNISEVLLCPVKQGAPFPNANGTWKCTMYGEDVMTIEINGVNYTTTFLKADSELGIAANTKSEGTLFATKESPLTSTPEYAYVWQKKLITSKGTIDSNQITHCVFMKKATNDDDEDYRFEMYTPLGRKEWIVTKQP